MNLSLTNRAKIGLEALESREVMTVASPTFTLSGELTFTSDSGGDNIEIVDTGLAGAGQLHFRINGGSWQTAPIEVGRVVLNMGDGNDTVIHNMGLSFDASKPDGLGNVVNGKVAGLYRGVDANMGGGDDRFTATITGNVAASGMHVVVDGQNGNDILTGTLNGDLTGGARLGFLFRGGTDAGTDFMNVFLNNDVDIAAGCVLWTNMNGGAGNDNLQFRYDGELDGQLSLDIEGEADADWVRAEVTLDPGSLGRLGNATGRARVYGGDGDGDTADFLVHDNAGTLVGVDAEVGGGRGFDTVHLTSNVVWLGD
jgi:hypothetical protein